MSNAKLIRLPVISLVVMASALAVGLSMADDHAKHAHKADEASKVLQERMALLQQIAKLQLEAYRSAEARFDDVLHAQSDVLSAKLELAKTPAERAAIRQAVVKIAEQLEKATQRSFRAKEATRVDLLKAQAFLLRAKADLLLERSHKHHD